MAKQSMPWFRLYTEMPSDRKIRRLKVEHRWLWVCVLCAARSSPIHGLLLVADGVPCDDQDLADLSGLTKRQVAAGIAAMADLEMLRRNDEADCWEVAGWDGRQFASDTSTDRVRAHRKRSKKQERNGDATLHGTERNGAGNAPETEQSRGVTSLTTGSDAWPDPPEDPTHGSDIWFQRLAATVGDDIPLTTAERIAELRLLHAEQPLMPGPQLAASLRAGERVP